MITQLTGVNKQCKRCGFTAPIEWFNQHYSHENKELLVTHYRQTICPMCQQEERDKRKWQNRAIVKAKTAIYNHTKRYNQRNDTALTPSQFVEAFGWPNLATVAKLINHTYKNSCHYCHTLYADMGHGLRDITFDVIDPDNSPFWANIRLCCATCNRIKGHRGSEAFGLHLSLVRQRHEYLLSKPGSPLKPQFVMNLFR